MQSNSVRISQGRWIIAFVMLVHISWAILLCISLEPLSTVPLAALAIFGPRFAVAILIFVSLCACFGLFEDADTKNIGILWYIPQQLLLTLTSMTAVLACLDGEYADGTLRPPIFICADQSYAIFVAVMHFFALIERYNLWRLWVNITRSP